MGGVAGVLETQLKGPGCRCLFMKRKGLIADRHVKWSETRTNCKGKGANYELTDGCRGPRCQNSLLAASSPKYAHFSRGLWHSSGWRYAGPQMEGWVLLCWPVTGVHSLICRPISSGGSPWILVYIPAAACLPLQPPPPSMHAAVAAGDLSWALGMQVHSQKGASYSWAQWCWPVTEGRAWFRSTSSCHPQAACLSPQDIVHYGGGQKGEDHEVLEVQGHKWVGSSKCVGTVAVGTLGSVSWWHAKPALFRQLQATLAVEWFLGSNRVRRVWAACVSHLCSCRHFGWLPMWFLDSSEVEVGGESGDLIQLAGIREHEYLWGESWWDL